MSSPKAESIALFFQQGSSDKEYHVHLKAKDAGWIVEFQYGRRGSALKSGLKTKDPIDFDAAKKIYDKVVQGQLKDGYTQSETGAAYQDSSLEKRFTGIIPQLLNAMEEDEFETVLSGKDWVLQEKFDGNRLLIKRDSGKVTGINRKGLEVAIAKKIEAAVLSIKNNSFLIDCEWLGERIAPFDILEIDGKDLRAKGYLERKDILDAAIASSGDEDTFIHVVTAKTEKDKRALHERVRAACGEGTVGKIATSPYTPGRPNSGGNQVKRKFVESATVFVSKASASKRSVAIAALDSAGKEVAVGNVTISSNFEIPEAGSIIEVHYLYAYEGGSLYQPVYKGARGDQDKTDCVMSQLKYKANGPATARPSLQKVKTKI